MLNLLRRLREPRPTDVAEAIAVGVVYDVTAFDRNGRRLWTARAKNRIPTVGLNKFLDATLKTGLATPLWYLGLVGASISDAAITSGQAALTSASNPWLAEDVGRAIVVRGAGSSGGDLVTTILSRQSAGAVTLTDNAGTTVTAAKAAWDARAGDTMASHAPWVTNTNYSNANRPTWTPGAVAAGSVDNSASPGSFSINADNTIIFGAFMADNNTVGGTTGTLLSMGVFSGAGSRQVNNGDTLQVTATVQAQAV
jgi:hypothetical protein